MMLQGNVYGALSKEESRGKNETVCCVADRRKSSQNVIIQKQNIRQMRHSAVAQNRKKL